MTIERNPSHASAVGYTTAQGRQDWVTAHGRNGREVPVSLEADPDRTQPLYYWQIYSLLGPHRIEELVRKFYTKVYDDTDDPEFRRAFSRISGMEHHIATQTAFWIDAFGGGRAYHGGDYRLNFHHEHNAHQVMNSDGAKRWMYHMGEALCETNFSDVDPRIKPCIIDFLKVKMQKYANQHGWKFDKKDFDFESRDPELLAQYEAEVDTYNADIIQEMGTKDLKKFLEYCGQNFDDCREKSELQKLGQRALQERLDEAVKKLDSLSNKELKALLLSKGVDFSHCVEKSEMLELARKTLVESQRP